MEKRQSLQQMVLEKLDGHMQRRMKLDHFLTSYTKIDSKWMKDLNVRHESIKMLEQNTCRNFCVLGRSNFLLDPSPKVRETKSQMNYLDVIKIKSFCTVKKKVDKTKRQQTEW